MIESWKKKREKEAPLIAQFKELAPNNTYKQISELLGIEVKELYKLARTYQIEVKQPWDKVSQHFTSMLEQHIQGLSYRALGVIYGVTAVRIHAIFADNGYTDFRDDTIVYKTNGAKEFADNYRREYEKSLKECKEVKYFDKD